MTTSSEIEKHFRHLGPDLLKKMVEECIVKDFPKNTEIIREGQFVKVVPIILDGIVKVFTRQEDKELLLYYIRPDESCIMSFTACLNSEKSKIFAVTEEDTTAILIPAQKLAQWVLEYPKINQLFYHQFDLRYSDLINTINHLIYDKLDKRLLNYLKEKVAVTGKNPVKISHKEIANDLSTAREVISRLLKKLEKENKVKQLQDSIHIF